MNAIQQLVQIADGPVTIEGMLEVPENPLGLVLFAHGSGSSRFSPRNNYVAGVLRQAGIGTLLLDLLTAQEDETYATRFNIGLLTRRLIVATQWLQGDSRVQQLPIGYFGASTGAAAALQAAAKLGNHIRAVVSRGGRPDLAGSAALREVMTPTLLLVGGHDGDVIELNQAAAELLPGEKTLHIIPGATHLFEEPGTLEAVARQAAAWFKDHFSRSAT